MFGLLEQYKVIFGHLESIFAFSQSLGKKQKCLRLAWMNWNIIISKLEGIFSICKSYLIRVQYCIWWNETILRRNTIFFSFLHFCHHFCIFAIFVFAFLHFWQKCLRSAWLVFWSNLKSSLVIWKAFLLFLNHLGKGKNASDQHGWSSGAI